MDKADSAAACEKLEAILKERKAAKVAEIKASLEAWVRRYNEGLQGGKGRPPPLRHRDYKSPARNSGGPPPLAPRAGHARRNENLVQGAAMKYGYARVSTDGQSLDAQVKELRAAGAEKVFRETARGAQTNRAQLDRALAQLGKGDVLTVTRLDRLARSTRDLLNTLATITSKGAGFRSLNDVWADTTTAHGRLMLTVLGGLAEFERELIRAHTGEGRARAKARGQSLGRPFKLTPHQRQEAARRRDSGEETLTEIGRTYNVSAATISRLAP